MDMPDNQADRQSDSSDSARWMTFAELAKVRGISKLSATTLVRRHGWRRQRDNQGHVIALVPLTWTNPDVGGQADDLPDKRADNRPDSQGYIAAFEAALVTVREAHAGEVSALRERAEAAERRADSECQRADSADRDRRTTEGRVAAAEARADRAEQANAGERANVDALRDRLSAMQAQLADANAALQAAEAAEARADRAEQDKERAEAGRDAMQMQLAAEAEAADQARRRAQEALQAAEAIAAVSARAEAERKSRGRLARLRAAWWGK
jgi:hypothetical protein